jgi:ABC-type enterochelin transport system substrate-binding protein
MSHYTYCIALAVVLTGCAAAHERPAALATAPETSSAATVQQAQSSTAEAARAPEQVAEVAVLDANTLDPGSVVICREMLKPSSNVIVRQCMTRDDWKRYERMQTLQAQTILRQMQGNAFP